MSASYKLGVVIGRLCGLAVNAAELLWRSISRRFRLNHPAHTEVGAQGEQRITAEDRFTHTCIVFAAFVIAHRALTGFPPRGTDWVWLVQYYVGFLLIPTLVSLLSAALLWFAVYLVCFCVGVSTRAPGFTTTLLVVSIIVCGALLYGTYCLEGGQYCFTVDLQAVSTGLHRMLRLDQPLAPLPPLR